MSELYRVDVVSKKPLAELPASAVVDEAIVRYAKDVKWKGIAAFEKDPRAALTAMVAELKKEKNATAAAKRLKSKYGSLSMGKDMQQVVLHLAGHGGKPKGEVVELAVTQVHPDASLPDHRDPFRTLPSFVLRVIADGSKDNVIIKRYGDKITGKLRARDQDLWRYRLAPAKRVKAPAGGKADAYATTLLTVITDGDVVRHLKAGAAYASTAFADQPGAKFAR